MTIHYRDLENKLPIQGQMFLCPNFLSEAESTAYFQLLFNSIPWRQESVVVFGKSHPQPRLVSWHGEPGLDYQYSGLKLSPQSMGENLRKLKKKIEDYWSIRCNSVLLNLYRDGEDCNGWHRDNEPELGSNPNIASLSLGETRDFLVKHRFQKDRRLKLSLQAGSCLLMSGEMQSYWLHSLPRRKKVNSPRINLTFRWINS